MNSPALDVIENSGSLADIFPFDGSEKSLENLGWFKLLRILEGMAFTEPGRELARVVRPLNDIVAAEWMMDETDELLRFIRKGTDLPIRDFPNLVKTLNKAEKENALSGKELRDVSGFLDMSAGVKNALKVYKEQLSHLAPISSCIEDLKQLRIKIEMAVDPEGDIRESASPFLKRALAKARTARNRLTRKAGELISSKAMAEVMQDNFYTLREDRIVIPVKAEMRSQVDGIVHASSASGQTVFMEPVALVELNNRLKVAQMEVEQETRRILAELALMVSAEIYTIRNSVKAITYLDLARARASLADKLDSVRPKLERKKSINLKSLRHPLLAMQISSKDIIPNDVILKPGTNVLVISGPNAGGKTVALKSVGLAAAMVRAGMLIPAGANSHLPFYGKIFADIGDEQDIAMSLSSYSAHMLKLKEILAEAGQDTLILLDELATSTDPTEGAALAASVLDAIIEIGATAIVTTHFPSLKAQAQVTKGFMNASMEFDVAGLQPTYRLLMGSAGRSAAFEIAQRLGLNENIILKARARVEKEKSRAEVAVEEIEEQLRAADRSRREAQKELEELKRLRADAAERAQELKAEHRKFKRELRQKLKAEVEEAKSEIEKALKDLRSSKTEADVVLIKKEIKKIEEQVTVPEEVQYRNPTPPPGGEFKLGDVILLKKLDSEGTISKLDKKKITVRIGKVDMSVKPDDVAFLSRPGENTVKKRPHSEQAKRNFISRPLKELASLTIDLRGMRADEALSNLEKYFDDASYNGTDMVRVIHGHGTGALKKIVRDMLKDSHYVEKWQPESEGQGGDGVTVVKLKS